jgi:hypothetical protein
MHNLSRDPRRAASEDPGAPDHATASSAYLLKTSCATGGACATTAARARFATSPLHSVAIFLRKTVQICAPNLCLWEYFGWRSTEHAIP